MKDDAVLSLQSLQTICLENHIPFISFSQPGTTNTRTLIQTSTEPQILTGSLEEIRGFIISPFEASASHPTVLLQPDFEIENEDISREIIEELNKHRKEYSTSQRKVYETTNVEYIDQANTIIKKIKQEKIVKAILSRLKVIEKPAGFNPSIMFQLLKDAYPKAYIYLLNLPGIGTWMGATPERLLKTEGEYILTEALAGTIPYQENSTDNYWTEKEKHEQALVEQYIADLLDEFQVKNHSKTDSSTVRAGNLLHLKSSFKIPVGEINNLMQFLQALHPTPAVCGLPKENALKIIKMTENHSRAYYAGFLGEINTFKNSVDLYVNLRCMEITGDHLILYIGGGITFDSIPEKEWDETRLKADTLLDILEKMQELS